MAYSFLRWLVVFLLFFASRPIQAQVEQPYMPPDNWGGYSAHMLASGVIGYGLTTFAPAIFKRDIHPAATYGLCMVPGVLKEVADFRRGQDGFKHGLFSRKDLISDTVGCMAGIALGMSVQLGVNRFGEAQVQYSTKF